MVTETMLLVLLASASIEASPAPAAAPRAQSEPKPSEPKKDERKPASGQVGEKIPAFTAKLAKTAEKPVDFDSTKTSRATAYLFVGTTCPATRPYADRLKALEAAYAGKVDFVYVYPNGGDENSASKVRFHKDSRFTGYLLDDEGARIAKLLQVDHTGLVILADKDGKVLYRGGIDDNLQYPNKVKHRWMAAALDEILAGKPVSAPSPGNVFGASVKS